MIFPEITDISIVNVYERGVPNKERILFKTNTWLDLCEFGVMICLLKDDGFALPYIDHFYHFKDENVTPNTQIFLYTGQGNDFKGIMPVDESPFSVYHWGKQTTVFANSRIIPVIFRIGQVKLATPPLDLPQLALKEK